MTVVAIHVAPERGGPCMTLDQGTLVPGRGIEGDHHHAEPDGVPASEVTFIEAEAVAAFNTTTGLDVDGSATRRNVLTTGVELNPLVGRRFAVGTALLEGLEPCDPCATLGRRLATPSVSASDVVKALANRGGLRARVVEGGVIAPGDEIRVV
ncbi:MAG: MOSC domain-containing protein [Gammaproteobacteria bacterium]|nr:MOSC domain-containing protein [Gammaproteobacteria bacterium]